MGNSLFIAKLFIGKFEIDLNILARSPGIWIRYADKAFYIFNTTKFWITDFSELNKIINSKFPFIKFTQHEEGTNYRIAFLDMLVTSPKNKAEIDVGNRKIINNRYILEDLNHSWKYKLATIHFLVHHLFFFSTERYNNELKEVFVIATFNGYLKYVYNIIRNQKNKIRIY